MNFWVRSPSLELLRWVEPDHACMALARRNCVLSAQERPCLWQEETVLSAGITLTQSQAFGAQQAAAASIQCARGGKSSQSRREHFSQLSDSERGPSSHCLRGLALPRWGTPGLSPRGLAFHSFAFFQYPSPLCPSLNSRTFVFISKL